MGRATADTADEAIDAIARSARPVGGHLTDFTDDDWDDDALLERLHRLGQEIRTAQHRLRLLLAYAREFQGRRPYPLSWLAEAAGMSPSGVRTAYDRDDVQQVADILGVPVPHHGD